MVGVGEVDRADAVRQDDGWGKGDEHSRSGKVRGMGGGDVGWA